MSEIKLNEIEINDLYFKIGLYQKVTIDTKLYEITEAEEGCVNITAYSYSNDFSNIIKFLFAKSSIVEICPKCNKQLTLIASANSANDILLNEQLTYFENEPADIDHVNERMKERIELLIKCKYYDKIINCSINKDHTYKFSFLIEYENSKLSIVKIGQYPSLSDFYLTNSKRYEKILSKLNLWNEYKTGCYLFAHGAGSGSYVYMRRIFEKIIFRSFDENHKSISVERNQFIHMRMDEKINILKNFLPDFLTNTPQLYPILSAGIHLLSEEDCLEFFHIVKNCIDYILEDIISKTEKEKLRKEANLLLSEVKGKITKIIDVEGLSSVSETTVESSLPKDK